MTITENFTEALGNHANNFVVNGRFWGNNLTPESWLYVTDSENEDGIRYVLGQPRNENILIIGINPNDGVPEKPDCSLCKAVCNLRRNESYSGLGWITVNLYPERYPDPKKFDSFRKKYFVRNLKAVRAVRDCFDISFVWAAWGDSIEINKCYIASMRSIVDSLGNINWVHNDELTKKGNPRHFYCACADLFRKFDIIRYVKTIQGE